VIELQPEAVPPVEQVVIEPARPPVPLQVEPPLEQLPPPEQQIYYQQPPPRPLTEMLGGTGSFFFLQDSELDTPDTLPSQTFTNTSYVQAPPPPIPLPPNFQTYQQGNPNVPPPPGNGVEEQPPQQPQPPQPDETQKHRGQPRPNNQTYYQNNNNTNYNNRPRQHRNGPRAGNRHQ